MFLFVSVQFFVYIILFHNFTSLMYSVQHCVIKFVNDLMQIGGSLPFPLPIKLTATI